MPSDYLQNTRYKLQKRVRRLNGADWEQFIYLLRQFWVYFDANPIFTGIVTQLTSKFPNYAESAEKIMGGKYVVGENEEEAAAIAYGVLRLYSGQERPDAVIRFLPNRRTSKFNEMVDQFRSLHLEPFYEFVDERLDDPRFILSALIRFKHLCEWFWRKDLYEQWTADTARGEKKLALRLYEHLYSQGIQFSIEPWSISGEADLVSSQLGDDRLIADAKIFNPDKNKSARYIIQGFRQLYQYTSDYNEPIGYLIIFNTSDKHLRFVLSAPSEPLAKVVVNNKTIFFITIDLYPA